METTGTRAVHHGSKPRILLAASTWWPASARLARALILGGCEVSAICPPGHPLHYLGGIGQLYELRALRSRHSLYAAIKESMADFIVPCDDRVVSQLHELFALHPELRALIECSLGDPDGFPIADSRSDLLQVAADLGIRIPRTITLDTQAEVDQNFLRLGPVAVMKLDGTHGGEGVRIVRSVHEAVTAYRQLRRNTGLLTAVHRSLIYSDRLSGWSWARRHRSQTVLQEFVEGTPANNMVACWRGEVLGELAVECLSCQGPTGSASVVRRIENPEMSQAARLLAARLKISGFFGLDFMLARSSGRAYLIEMNPRCTQLGHLQFPQKGDLASALAERLTGQPRPQPVSPIAGDTVVFFPQAWKSGNPTNQWSAAFHDIPRNEPALVEYLMRPPWPDRRWLTRAYRLVRGRKS